jgi:hypothetical protein
VPITGAAKRICKKRNSDGHPPDHIAGRLYWVNLKLLLKNPPHGIAQNTICMHEVEVHEERTRSARYAYLFARTDYFV